MTRHEIKSQLAKLLATEDLVVEHKQCETASFNVHTRVLVLPLWEKASNVMYDMLVGHEVGHALFTPDQELSEVCSAPMTFFNIVEDPRIEKLMKRKYPGLRKSFHAGYKEMHEKDFFNLEGEDVSKMSFADRVNLHFKLGQHIDIPFYSDEEKRIINLIDAAETVEEAYRAAEEMYAVSKKQMQERPEMPQDMPQGSNGAPADQAPSADNNEGQGEGEDLGPGEDQIEGEENDMEELNKSYGGTAQQEEPEVKTTEALEDAIADLAARGMNDNVYLEVPTVNLDTTIAKNSEVHQHIRDSFKMQTDAHEEMYSMYGEGGNWPDMFATVDDDYKKFKKSAQKEVNYLVKEFECRKSATSYSRATVSSTGMLDCSKLHTYKFNDDLFKKVTTLPDGKNHGLIFILDWSGSMGDVMLDTIKQLYNLIWFCKKASIPFEVYAFTYEWLSRKYNSNRALTPVDHQKKKEFDLVVDNRYCLMNILTSNVRASESEQQMRDIYRIAYSFRYHVDYREPPCLSLSGTPLNEALITLHQIIPHFQKKTKVEKVQCVILTDGEASPVPFYAEVYRRNCSIMGMKQIRHDGCFIRDRKLGTTYSIGYRYTSFTDCLLSNLKDKFPQTSFVGFRLITGRDATSFMKMHCDYNSEEYDKIYSSWKKNKSFSIKSSAYDVYFGINANSVSQNAEFTVGEDATKTQIKSAFVKSLKNKKLNKKVLGEFVQLIS